MSLNINGERLLAEALADAMDRDLADVPAKEQLEKQHRFSGKFVRRIKRIEKGMEAGDGARTETGSKAGNETEAKAGKKAADGAGRESRAGDEKRQPRDFAELGKRAKHYGGMAAALVCIIGLTAVLSMMGRMGASKQNDAGAPKSEDISQWEEAQDDAASGSGEFLEGAEDAPAEEAAEIPAESEDDAPEIPAEDEAGAPASGDKPEETGGNQDFTGEPMAPGWQEQLLAESKKADALISWHLTAVYDGLSFVLDSELAGSGEADSPPVPSVSVSLIYEVYYQESMDDWVRVYHTNRSMSRCEPGTVWGDEYFMQELNMTKPGTYRVVRQVNGYRQVLELTMERAIL